MLQQIVHPFGNMDLCSQILNFVNTDSMWSMLHFTYALFVSSKQYISGNVQIFKNMSYCTYIVEIIM